MNGFDTAAIEQVVSAARGGQISPELPGIIYSLGRDAENDEEYAYAFETLLSLSSCSSIFVVSMVVLAFSLLAVYHKRLDRAVVEPLLRRAWERAEGSDKARIQCAVDDINHALQWNFEL